MMVLLNIETAEEITSLRIEQITGIAKLCQKMDIKHLDFLQTVYRELVQRIEDEMNVREEKSLRVFLEWFKSHAVKSFVPLRDRRLNTSVYNRWANHEYKISSPGKYMGLSAKCLAWASLKGGISVGPSHARLGDDIYYEVEERSTNGTLAKTIFSSLMFTKMAQSRNVDYLRWQYMIYGLDQGVAFPEHATFRKHFHREGLPLEKESLWPDAQWVKDTRDGEAMFMSGFKYGSPQFHQLVRFVLKQSYSQMRYTVEEQNEFVVDVRKLIGAANGKPTSKVKLYVTKQNVIHVRPCEQRAVCTADVPFEFDC